MVGRKEKSVFRFKSFSRFYIKYGCIWDDKLSIL